MRGFIILQGLAALLFLVPGGIAQTITATLRGLVTDSTDAVIPGAVVTVTNTATNAEFSTETGPAGRFVAPSLQPGP